MSFLSRKPARPGDRGGDAGRDDEYDDYDLYSADGYQGGEDAWSPNEYFSPEGIKGRWAGEHPEGRAGGRGRREADPSAGHDAWQHSVEDGYRGAGRGASSPGSGRGDDYPGYVADEYASGAYDIPQEADEDRPERGRRRRRDREDRGERTGILRLRRDRGEDMWPDDGISDEDYWASVAADRPLTDSGAGDDRAPAGRRAGTRPGDDRPASGQQASEQQAGGPRDQRGRPGRLGPPPGLASDYLPGGAGLLADPAGRPGTGPQDTRPGPGGRTSGPNAMRPGPDPAGRSSGPNAMRPGPDAARRASGPNAMRPGPDALGRSSGANPLLAESGPQGLRGSGSPGPRTGAAPTVGVTASRPPAGGRASSSGPNPGWTSRGQSGTGSGAFPQPPARPTFQPAGYPPASAPGGRPAARDDWGEPTERIERVNASGYPDPRPASRGQAPATGSPLRAGTAADPSPGSSSTGRSGTPGLPGASGLSRASGRGAPSGPYPRGRDDRGRATDREAGDPGTGSFDRASFDRNGTDRDGTGRGGRDRGGRDRGGRDTGGYGADSYSAGSYGTGGRDSRGDTGGWSDADHWRTPDRDEPARPDSAVDTGGSIWSAPARDAGPAHRAADDPLTSTAYSRSALTDTDGRSYRAAARRSQAQAKLTDQADTYLSGPYRTGGYQAASDYPTASFQPVGQPSGEYRQYSESQYSDARYRRDAASAQAQAAPYPAASSQPGSRPPAGPAQPALGEPTLSQPALSQPALSQPVFTPGQASQPGRAGGAHAAPSPGPGQPLSAPVPPGGTGAGAPAGANPYDGEATGSYPYPASDPYAARPGTAAPARPGADDLYYRVSTGGSYPGGPDARREQARRQQARRDQTRAEQGGTGYRPGHAAGQPGYGERPY